MIWVRWFYNLFERMRLERKRTMFIHTNQPLITWFYIKKVPIFVELAMSQRWSAIFCATGALGGKPIVRVRVNLEDLNSNIVSIIVLKNGIYNHIRQRWSKVESKIWSKLINYNHKSTANHLNLLNRKGRILIKNISFS